MSGYRSLHRELVLPQQSIWSVATTPLLTTTKQQQQQQQQQSWRLWIGSSNGRVLQAFVVHEISLERKAADLTASAVRLQCTHEFVGHDYVAAKSTSSDDSAATTRTDSTTMLGCSSVSIVRNYVGEDEDAGDFVIMTLEVAGRVRIWNLLRDWDDSLNKNDSTATSPSVSTVKALFEFDVDSATGTSAALCPPRVSGHVGEIMAAVACLDGTIAMVATGLVTPNYTKEAAVAGTMLESWGSRGSAIPLCLSWHPKKAHVLCVGRQDGSIDILTQSRQHQHRLVRHTAPVRAVAFTDDGHLLVSGSDAGVILIWDCSRPRVPALVHHVMDAHKSRILNIAMLPDSRRFITCGADRKVQVWNVGQIHQPVHTFQTDAELWALARGPAGTPGPRLVTGSDDGHVQVYSLEK